MKKNLMKYGIFMIMLCFASCSSCKKEIDALPSATQEGKNTFGCLIDGQAYVPNGGGGLISSAPISGGYAYSSITCAYRGKNVWINTYSKDGKRISLYLENVVRTGIYPLKYTTPGAPSELCPPNHAIYSKNVGATPTAPSTSYLYATDSEYTGEINITRADTVNRIVSGTFFFKARRPSTSEIIEITNGRFDVKN